MTLRILARAPVWFAGSAVMLVLINRQLALMVTTFIPLIMGLMWLFARKAQPLFLLVQKQLDKLNTVLQENLAGVRVVKAFVRIDHETARFDEANRQLMTKTIQVMQLMALLMPTMMLIVNLGIVGVVWFGGISTIRGEMTVGQIVAAISYLSFVLFPIMMLAGMIGPLSAADASASRILEILDSSADVQESSHARHLSRVQGKIAFEGVSFNYSGNGSDPVLKDISFIIEPGKTVAILGTTGAGKSTLIHLIPRFYDVTAGRVTIDGINVRDLKLDFLRRQIGIALQEAILFSETVRNNICYGQPQASDDEIIAAAQAAQAHEFIKALPQSYDTIIGQRGVNLSGGQQQRIAIARALLVKPKILILDDSTSAVDVETESKLQDALDQLLQQSRNSEWGGATRIIVAQRISTVLLADKIIVLDKGRITAMGTHHELLSTSSLYQDIYRSQLGDGRHLRGDQR
jgi:ATP-binding cassette subfamily B protein